LGVLAKQCQTSPLDLDPLRGRYFPRSWGEGEPSPLGPFLSKKSTAIVAPPTNRFVRKTQPSNVTWLDEDGSKLSVAGKRRTHPLSGANMAHTSSTLPSLQVQCLRPPNTNYTPTPPFHVNRHIGTPLATIPLISPCCKKRQAPQRLNSPSSSAVFQRPRRLASSLPVTRTADYRKKRGRAL
jgi:hypothetical protein